MFHHAEAADTVLIGFMKMGALIFSLLSTPAMAVAATDPSPAADEFGSPLVLFMLLVLGAVSLVLVGMGIVLSLAFLVCAAIFVAFGVVSSSALVALLHRRFSSGLRALHYQLLALIGLPCGAGVFWLGCAFFEAHLRHRYVLAIGGAIGVVAGLGMAFILDRFSRFVYHRFRQASAGIASA